MKQMPDLASPEPISSTRLLFVRHGQIQANISRHWHGSTDSPMTEKGLLQADRVSDRLASEAPDIGAIYSSPSMRARITATTIGQRLGIMPNTRAELAEYGIGEWEGVHYRELLEKYHFFTRIQAAPEFAPAGGESLRQVLARVTIILQKVSQRHAGETVLLVGHGASMAMTLAHHIDGDFQQWRNYLFDNCSITEFRFLPRVEVIRLNQTEHLGDLSLPPRACDHPR